MKLIEILPKIPQWESIPYNPWLDCGCGEAGFGSNKEKLKLIGWCDTDFGYMGVFECPLCYERYRFHGTIGTWSADKKEFGYYLRFYASQCANWKEVELKLIEK